MEKNIFERAKFGDKFLTRDGRVAIFDKHFKTSNEYGLYVENDGEIFCTKHGDYVNEDYPDENLDIVSRYQEKIDENKLDELASEYKDSFGWNHEFNPIDDFKVGYRKAKNE